MLKLFRNSLPQPSDRSVILEDIEQAKSDLDCAYINFENAIEPDLIDCYIYQLKSAQMRYKFLLDCAKRADLRGRKDVAQN
ncbi:Protein of uncharacterised function (DUF2508) [uncultured Roseburia sp.]|uniref:YaaL family protein n=1 Tax=Brotonthovivens ammoniilytica TaxID=2981725 RepID=A0ABT2TI54_9FIRM|nr:YaaL family protein [Brotonthovivens ammoniilytica]MCU6761889.1 YaaL family protein [Brotonthovivens ammoniilytica]SCI49762.1 Protein of uncharacterised function (DUF2508) [uncultured Roseburia sp.]